MARYSIYPATYPSVLHSYLKEDPPVEAEIRLDTEQQAKGLRFKFWGLRNALGLAVERGELNWRAMRERAMRTEARLHHDQDGKWVVTLTPKEMINADYEYSIVYKRRLEPGKGLTEADAQFQRLAAEGERKLMERLGTTGQSVETDADSPARGGVIADPIRAQNQERLIPSKSLNELMQEEAERDDE